MVVWLMCKVKVAVLMTSLLMLSETFRVNGDSYLACYGSNMDHILCPVGYEIRIRTAYYVDNGAVHNCNENSDSSRMCRAFVYSTNSDYYSEILLKCNGHQTCIGLRAEKERTHCNGFINRKTDYVLLYYDCDPADTEPQETTRGQPASSSDPPDTAPPSDLVSSTRTSGGEMTPDAEEVALLNMDQQTHSTSPLEVQTAEDNVGFLVGFPLLALLVIAATVVLVLILRRRKQRLVKLSPSETNQTAGAQTQSSVRIDGATCTPHPVTYPNAVYVDATPAPPDNLGDNYVYDQPCNVKLGLSDHGDRRARPCNMGVYIDMGSVGQNTEAGCCASSPVFVSSTSKSCRSDYNVYSLERPNNAVDSLLFDDCAPETVYDLVTPKRSENEYISMDDFDGKQEGAASVYAEIPGVRMRGDDVEENTYSVPRRTYVVSTACDDDLIVLDNPIYSK